MFSHASITMCRGVINDKTGKAAALPRFSDALTLILTRGGRLQAPKNWNFVITPLDVVKFFQIFCKSQWYFVKVHIFWEAHKSLWNLHGRFDHYYIRQIYGGDFAKICGLLRIYELYQNCSDLLWEKNCSSDWENLCKFSALSLEFQKNFSITRTVC